MNLTAFISHRWEINPYVSFARFIYACFGYNKPSTRHPHNRRSAFDRISELQRRLRFSFRFAGLCRAPGGGTQAGWTHCGNVWPWNGKLVTTRSAKTTHQRLHNKRAIARDKKKVSVGFILIIYEFTSFDFIYEYHYWHYFKSLERKYNQFDKRFPASPRVVEMTTSGAASSENLVKM